MVIIPAMPMLLRAFTDRLREDQGRQLGRAVLFASVAGFDVVEQRKGDIAAVSGVPAARIQEIVDTGRQALSTVSPRRPEQHLISQALMRQFCIRPIKATGCCPAASSSAGPGCCRRGRWESSPTS